MSSKRINPLSQINWEQYFNNLKERAKAIFVFNNEGENYYIYEGRKLQERDFEMMLPLEIIRVNPKGDNKDGTHVK